jgi:predicted O-linked N-acetylglucosamine transferase (SPINDLY family)
MAVNLATNTHLLEGVRQKLARNRASAPLFDTARFTRNLESAYTRMHARNQVALPPDHVFIEPSA